MNGICDFGCGKVAIKTFKNGKECCCESVNNCENKREKDSSKKMGKTPTWKNGHPKGMAGKHAWNYGKTYVELMGEKEAKIYKDKLSKSVSNSPVKFTSHVDPEKEKNRRDLISKKMKIVGGGYRHGSGRGKKGWYKGYWCDSSYELAYVIYNLDHDIKFSRNTKRFEYVFEGEKHFWIPDFILEDGSYVEIKGYFTEQVKAKIEQFVYSIKVLRENDLDNVFSYVKNKYGKDYIKLYECCGR